MDNLFLYVSIVLLILLLICIIFTIRTSLDNKKLKRAANKSSISNQDLRDCVNMLIRDTNFDIYMYDDSCKTHYIMKDNEFTPSGLSLADIESLLHPYDKKRYKNEYKMAYEVREQMEQMEKNTMGVMYL